MPAGPNARSMLSHYRVHRLPWLLTKEGEIRRIAPALCVLLLGFAIVPHASTAAPSLALPRSDYPSGSRLEVIPATDAAADTYFAPAHRSTFERLGRVDGAGWLQFGIWHFSTGLGGAKVRHLASFGYGISVFHSANAANRAIGDVKLKTHQIRVAHLPAWLFQARDTRNTLIFTFFVYQSIEVEAYYEYTGVAPKRIAGLLSRTFSTQRAHIARMVRALSAAIQRVPTATATSRASSTATPTATGTPTLTATPTATASQTASPTPTRTTQPTSTATASPIPTMTSTPGPPATPTSTATPAATPTMTPTPTVTPTPTPTVLVVQASMGNQTYAPGDDAVVNVQVSEGGKPVPGASVTANFFYPTGPQFCQAQTDTNGVASCSTVVPDLPDGTRVQVQVQVASPKGEVTTVTISFTVHKSRS